MTNLLQAQQQTKTINTLFDDAIQYDVPYLADFIFYCVRKRKIAMNEPDEKLETIELTPSELQEFEEMRTKDMMKLRQVQLYAIKNTHNTYAFYFGKNVEEVANLHEQRTKQKVTKIYNCYNQMIDKSLYFQDTNETKTFREILKEMNDFPCFLVELNDFN